MALPESVTTFPQRDVSPAEETMAQAIVHKSGEGRAFWMLGGLYEVLLSSDESNGEATGLLAARCKPQE